MINYCMYTDIGGRSNNEDACDVKEVNGIHCFTVCDGLGGHDRGEVASATAVEEMVNGFAYEPTLSQSNLGALIQRAQDEVIRKQSAVPELSEIKTTLTAIITDGRTAYAGHVGDSRIYFFRKRKVIYQSGDHSVPYALYKSGRIKEKQIRGHEDGSSVIRSLGMEWDTPKYDIEKVENLEAGDGFLLCSDGFWEYILEKEMVKCLKKSMTAKDWMNRMLEIIATRQPTDCDNITCIVGIL